MSACLEVNKASCCFQVTLAEEKYEPALESSAQLDTVKENRHQSSAQQLEEGLTETCRMCEKIMRVSEKTFALKTSIRNNVRML